MSSMTEIRNVRWKRYRYPSGDHGRGHEQSEGVVDVEPMKYHCSMGVMVCADETHGELMLRTVLDSGSGISILGEAGLRRLQQHVHGLTLVHPYEGGPSMYLADGWKKTVPQQADLLTVYIMIQWASVVIHLQVFIRSGVDNSLILGSKTPKEQLNIDVINGLWVTVQGQGELQ